MWVYWPGTNEYILKFGTDNRGACGCMTNLRQTIKYFAATLEGMPVKKIMNEIVGGPGSCIWSVRTCALARLNPPRMRDLITSQSDGVRWRLARGCVVGCRAIFGPKIPTSWIKLTKQKQNCIAQILSLRYVLKLSLKISRFRR